MTAITIGLTPVTPVSGPRVARGRMATSTRVPAAVQPPASAVRGQQPALRLTARGRLVLSVLAALLVAPVVLWGTGAMAAGEPEAIPVETYTVVAGETWWSIASSVAEPGADLRDVVRDLLDLNGVSGSSLQAGQQVLVPARG